MNGDTKAKFLYATVGAGLDCGMPLDEIKALFTERQIAAAAHVINPALYPDPSQPKCAGCGTTENLQRDLGSGGPYRCDSPGCMVF